MNRYNQLSGTFAREIVLLKGTTCSYNKCKFCNYTLDNSEDSSHNFIFNQTILKQVRNLNGQLEVINSGNVTDLDCDTYQMIQQLVNTKKINIIYFESYINEMKNFDQIRKDFLGCEVRFRLGLETFNDQLRAYLGKPFKIDLIIEKLQQQYYSVCLLCCFTGQTIADIQNDITLGLKYFQQITLNVFVDNGTQVTADKQLKAQFINEIYPQIKDHPRIELLIDNKDLGVFEQ